MKKRKVIYLSTEAISRLKEEQKRKKALARPGEKDIKVSQIVEEMILGALRR